MSIELHPLKVVRIPGEFSSDHTRVIARYFQAGDEERTRATIQRVLDLCEDEVVTLFDHVRRDYFHRHIDLEKTLLRHFEKGVSRHLPDPWALSPERRLLLGAYFTMEYSVEAAALFNPSIVPHPNQENVPAGAVRFIISFRATGEGHISSIVFRSGIIDQDGNLSFDLISPVIGMSEVKEDTVYDKHLFELKLNEMDACDEVTALVLSRLPDEFTIDRIEGEMARIDRDHLFAHVVQSQSFETMRWLAHSNYELRFPVDRGISERVIFPVSENERNGIEDARFVRFTDDDGTVAYYATYTAYNGVQILPQLIKTRDFVTFRIITLNGRAVQDKGMALFPRRVNGNYVMISRQDGVNLRIMCSNHLHFWQESHIMQCPERPWEFTQIGNCGSPMETEDGWLLLTHGVGPMRKYCIGVDLLDLHDPSRVIARLNEPILAPNEYEREGYVPNVVYTCGYMSHGGQLIIPYAMSDSKCAIASLSVAGLLERLRHVAA